MSTEVLHTATLHIHIYIYIERERGGERERGEMYPPVNQAQRPCIPLHCIYIHIEREGRWTPQSIKHRGLAYCYTAYIYREKGDIYIERRRWTPQSIKHRGLAYHYTAYI